jgi:RND family efflux transporter MFP subunit
MVELRPRVSGYLDSVHFQDGAEVKAGELLFVIDPRPYQAELERAQAQRRQAESHLEGVENDLKRAESLRGTKAISEEEYDTRSKVALEARAALGAAKANERAAQINIDYTQIKAPINGKIGRRLITPGNVVQVQGNGGAATLLGTLVSVDPIYCYFDVQEEAFLEYRQQGHGAISIPCELALVNETGFPHRGHVDFLDNQVDPKTGTIRMRAVFDNADRSLLPGFFANVRVLAGVPAKTLLIPDVAVGSDQGRKFVLVVNSDNVVATRSVKTGRQHEALRAVLEGLDPKDQVVVNGLMMARPGVKVEIQDTPAAPNSEPASKVADAKGTAP